MLFDDWNILDDFVQLAQLLEKFFELFSEAKYHYKTYQ